MLDNIPIDVPSEIIPDTAAAANDNNKIDKAADIFVTLLITFIQLGLAALLITFGLSIFPIVKFTALNVIKIFGLLVGIKFIVAGYQVKKI